VTTRVESNHSDAPHFLRTEPKFRTQNNRNNLSRFLRIPFKTSSCTISQKVPQFLTKKPNLTTIETTTTKETAASPKKASISTAVVLINIRMATHNMNMNINNVITNKCQQKTH
jgi:hypothetical protein